MSSLSRVCVSWTLSRLLAERDPQYLSNKTIDQANTSGIVLFAAILISAASVTGYFYKTKHNSSKWINILGFYDWKMIEHSIWYAAAWILIQVIAFKSWVNDLVMQHIHKIEQTILTEEILSDATYYLPTAILVWLTSTLYDLADPYWARKSFKALSWSIGPLY